MSRTSKKRYVSRRPGPVKVSYLPGYKPPPEFQATKFPFAATINGERCVVWPDWIEHLDEYDDDDGVYDEDLFGEE